MVRGKCVFQFSALNILHDTRRIFQNQKVAKNIVRIVDYAQSVA